MSFENVCFEFEFEHLRKIELLLAIAIGFGGVVGVGICMGMCAGIAIGIGVCSGIVTQHRATSGSSGGIREHPAASGLADLAAFGLTASGTTCYIWQHLGA